MTRSMRFKTEEEAYEAGWVAATKIGEDVSTPPFFGYTYAYTKPSGERVISTNIWLSQEKNAKGERGAFLPMFHTEDLAEEGS